MGRLITEDEIRQAVGDALVSCGDGSYVTSFDTEPEASIVIDRVTEHIVNLMTTGEWPPRSAPTADDRTTGTRGRVVADG
jgi:hypothetical protein